jgi:hypothetical protein
MESLPPEGVLGSNEFLKVKRFFAGYVREASLQKIA